MALPAATIWRDFETGSSGTAHKPIKNDIRAWGAAVELTGFAVPGAQLVPLFSQGVGVAAAFRAIVGFDLPNPSTTTPGAVFAKPFVAGQILSGLDGAGNFTTSTTTGTGSIVLSDNPNFGGTTIQLNSTNLIGSTGGTHVFYAPDGRLAVQLGGSGNPNFYKAATHAFYNATGSDLFASLDQYTLDLQPLGLTGALTTSALKITQTWNTTGIAACFDVSIADVASGIGSWFMRARGGVPGTTIMWYVDKGGSGTYAGNLNIGGVLVFGTKNFARYNGSGIDYFNVAAGGLRWLNEAGAVVLESLSNTGVRSYGGSTSGTHTVAAPPVAAGASTWPLTSGELWNTGMGVPFAWFTVAADFNAANTDHAITINLPAGFTRYNIASVRITNTGTTASLTTATGGLFTSAAGAGTALVASGTALSGVTSNAAGTAGSHVPLTVIIATTYQTDTTLFWRTQTAQGAAASGYISIQIVPIS